MVCLSTYSRGGNKIWIFKPQVNFDVIPTYKHGGKWFFEFGGHLNPPHLRWSFRFFGDFRPFQRNLYIFINAGLEPKLFEIKSSTQQQSCKAHKIGQLCQKDLLFICLCSKVRIRALILWANWPFSSFRSRLEERTLSNHVKRSKAFNSYIYTL